MSLLQFARFASMLLLGATAAAVAAPFAYVPNQKSGSISVIDTASDKVVRTLTAQGKLGDRVQAIDVDARGTTLYAVDAGHEQLLAVDTATDRVQHTDAIGADAEGVRLSPVGRTLAVCAEGQHQVLLVDAASFAISARIKVRGRNPEHCEFSPDGAYLVTSNEGSDDLDVIDLATRTSVDTIATAGHPRGAAFLPHSQILYVAQETANGVDLIDFGARSKLLTIATAERAAGVSAAPNGQRIYVANGSGSVSVIDVASHVVIREISVGKRPWNMALTPDGRKLYVANGRSNSVSIIDTGKLAVVAEVAVGEMPWGVVIPQSKSRGD
jgi:YVTN family beta-propeller protein